MLEHCPKDCRIDVAFAKIGKRRRVAFNIPHFKVSLYLAPWSDLIVSEAEQVAMRLAAERYLVMAEITVGGEHYDACIVWHRRFEQDRGHIWLREIGLAPEKGSSQKYVIMA